MKCELDKMIYLNNSNSQSSTTDKSTRISSINDVIGIRHRVIGEAIMCKVNLPNSFVHSTDELRKWAETILILHAAMDTCQWHHGIVQNEPDVSRLPRGWATENLGDKLTGKRCYLANDVRLITSQKLRQVASGKLRTRLRGM